jgi:DNA-binding CsgD family transcriptional regulator/tetratricopeptide (TPR) repeat protein
MADPAVGARSPLVGRGQDLAALQEGQRQAVDGTARTVLVTGEAGVGKTRLINEFIGASEGVVLAGGCIPVVGEALPFAPLTQALRDFRRRSTDRAPGIPADLMRLLPPDPSQSAEPIAARASDAPVSTSAQVRLFESLLGFLSQLAASGPVTVVIEDVHWADRSTLDLVGFLARNVRAERVLLVLTLRSDDVGPDTPFRFWLAELERLPTTTKLDLLRLTRDDTAYLLSGLLGSIAPASLVDEVHQRSAGNPLFAEHLLAWSNDPQGSVPETLRDLLGSRVALLAEPTRRVLRAASVLGRVVSLDLLAEIAEQSEADAEEALRPAVERYVVEPRADGDYGFRHPLFREVVYSELLPGERRRLHAAAAKSLSCASDGSFSVAGEVARHWQAAGDVRRAFRSAVAAGLAAAEVYALADAAEDLARAVELSRELPDEAFDQLPVDRVELFADAAQMASLVGHSDRATILIRDAAAMTDDPVRQSPLLEREGAYCFNTGRFDESEVAYQGALKLLPEQPPTPIQARVYAGLGMLAMADTRLDEALEICDRAVAIAQAVDGVREEGRALNARGVVAAYQGDIDDGVEQLRRSLEIAEELQEPDDLAAAYIHLSHVLGLAARFDEMLSVGKAGTDALRRIGMHRQEGSFLLANLSEALIKVGRWPEAADLLRQALAQRSQGLQSFPVLVQSARLSLVIGDLDAAQERVDQAAALLADGGAPDAWHRERLEVATEVALWQRRPEDAARLADEGIALVEGNDEQRFAGQLVVLALRAQADVAETARARRIGRQMAAAIERGDAIVARARSLQPDPLAPDADEWPESPALALTGRAELARLADKDDPRRWDSAASAWEEIDRPFAVAYARWREADAIARQHERCERSITAVRRAHRLAIRLGASVLASEVSELARWYRIDLAAPATETRDSSGVESDTEDSVTAVEDIGLTPRELEVLAGLAAGKTNRELADELFISVKTASVHVSNILRKLDVSGREEAARVAYRLGLDQKP